MQFLETAAQRVGLAKKPDPIEEAKKWKRNIQREVRGIERTIAGMDREEVKLKKEIQKLAKEGDSRKKALLILAKDLVRHRKSKEKMIAGKAMLNSVATQIQLQISTIKVAGCMQKSAEVMHAMNDLIKIPELAQACQEMAREMEKAGLIEEMVGDAMESVDATDEDEVEAEVGKVLAELSLSVMGAAPMEPTGPVAQPATAEAAGAEAAGAGEATEAEKEREELELKHMRERLNAL